jgi:hypothetical protein
MARLAHLLRCDVCEEHHRVVVGDVDWPYCVPLPQRRTVVRETAAGPAGIEALRRQRTNRRGDACDRHAAAAISVRSPSPQPIRSRAGVQAEARHRRRGAWRARRVAYLNWGLCQGLRW